MIEFCTKRRMIIGIAALITVSVIVLVIENNISYFHGMKDATRAPGNVSKNCWENDRPEVIQECQKCTSLEKKIHDFCKETGYRERVKCVQPPKEIYKSCPKLTWIEERNFWIFQTVCAMLGTISYIAVVLRQKWLDRRLIEKVHRQIAAGV